MKFEVIAEDPTKGGLVVLVVDLPLQSAAVDAGMGPVLLDGGGKLNVPLGGKKLLRGSRIL